MSQTQHQRFYDARHEKLIKPAIGNFYSGNRSNLSTSLCATRDSGGSDLLDPCGNGLLIGDILHVAKGLSALHPPTEQLPDPMGRNTVTARELLTTPPAHEVQSYRPPLNVRAMLSLKARDLGRKTHLVVPDSLPQSRESLLGESAARAI